MVAVQIAPVVITAEQAAVDLVERPHLPGHARQQSWGRRNRGIGQRKVGHKESLASAQIELASIDGRGIARCRYGCWCPAD